jgi:hypothetical protein
LDKYEDKLVEEWEALFETMKEDLGEDPSEEDQKKAAQALYKWAEFTTEKHPKIRDRVTEPFISRGGCIR